jgi:hypothetical protein
VDERLNSISTPNTSLERIASALGVDPLALFFDPDKERQSSTLTETKRRLLEAIKQAINEAFPDTRQ